MTGPTSSLEFKGSSDPLTAIAEQLGVQYLLTVSLRRAQGRLWVTAELVDVDAAATGFALWSGRYENRELTDIFDVQDEIVRAVGEALQVTLGLGANALPGRTRNLAAYEQWSRAFGLWYRGQRESHRQALPYAQRAIDLDSAYVPPRVVLHYLYRDLAGFFPDRADEYMRQAVDVLEEARRLAPDDPLVRSADSWDQALKGNWMPSGALLNDPSVAAATLGFAPVEGISLMGVGRAKEAVIALEAARTRDPYNPAVAVWLSAAYEVTLDFKASLAESDRGLALDKGNLLLGGGRLVRALGMRDRQQIEDELASRRNAGVPDRAPSLVLGRLLDEPAAALAEIRRMMARPTNTRLNYLEYALWAAYYGNPELALEMSRKTIGSGDVVLWWRPLFRDVRKLPAFKTFAREAGYEKYWRTYGWGDFCHPMGDDFECA